MLISFRYSIFSIISLSLLTAACSSPASNGPPQIEPPPPAADGGAPPPASTGNPPRNIPPWNKAGETPPIPVDHSITKPNLLIINDWSAHLGEGYDPATARFTGPCFTGDAEYKFDGSAVGSNFALNATADKVHAFLALYDYPFVPGTSISLAASDPRIAPFVSAAGVEGGALSFLAPAQYDLGALTLSGDQLLTKDPSCVAPKFVIQTSFGARFLFGIKLSFRDDDTRKAFTASYGVDIGKVLDTQDLTALGKLLDEKAKIQLQAFQLGGAAKDLEAIVNGSTCSIGDLAACRDTLTSLRKYGVTFVQSLPSPKEGKLDHIDGWAPFLLAPYATSDIPPHVN